MLQIKNISKEYITGNLRQMALNGVSLDLRDNEFVAILGPSGSGKTTLLNIIGGLDRYDSGDLIINGVTTNRYKDRDWDSYRNHTIGFVFQSYNLIPHQTVLANVELALTIGGISKAERKRRAEEALTKVGLKDHIHKKPNQLSGGQMQRVAIARALVNDPDILLADEPTGALDSETSIQVMDLLKEVAKDRLVVMVTHNPELAEEYATRIVRLKDGIIVDDSDPFDAGAALEGEPVHRNLGKASMSFATALALSFNNLWTKKTRTILVAFAGSIGIIGIALILALSTGVNEYIKNTEEETLSEYPLQIQKTSLDLASFIGVVPEQEEEQEAEVSEMKVVQDMFSKMDSNDLKALRDHLDNPETHVMDYANAVEYGYNLTPWIYRVEERGKEEKIWQVCPDLTMSAYGGGTEIYSMMGMNTNYFSQLPSDEGLYVNQYEVKAGRWPTKYDEAVLVLMSTDRISDYLLYILGFRDFGELEELMNSLNSGDPIEVEETSSMTFNYSDFMDIEFKVMPAFTKYVYDSTYKVWTDRSDNKDFFKRTVKDGISLKVVGVVIPKEGSKANMLSPGVGYLDDLTFELIDRAAESDIVKEQLKNKNKNVISGRDFSDEGEDDVFTMESLFSVDQNAFANAFAFDANAINVDFSDMDISMDGLEDLSSLMDMNSIADMMPEFKPEDLAKLFEGVEIKVDTEDMSDAFDKLMDGYQAYTGRSFDDTFQKMEDAMYEYLGSEDFRGLIRNEATEIVEGLEIPEITSNEMEQVVVDIMSGFYEFAENYEGNTEMSLEEAVNAYLASDTAQALIDENMAKLSEKMEQIVVPEIDAEALGESILSGYVLYLGARALPSVDQISEDFQNYISSPQASKIMMDTIGKALDIPSIEKKIGENMQSLMGNNSSSSFISEELITGVIQKFTDSIGKGIESKMTELADAIQDAFTFDEKALADAFSFNMTEEELENLMASLMMKENSSYDGNLKKFGYADLDEPYVVSIYPKDFESKDGIIKILDDYNSEMERTGQEDKVVKYTDIVGTLMSSVTSIINSISYVLIAFVAISLIVSSIMIGVITYISVLERRKEIGILRAIGASKGNIAGVFNAETFIIGLLAGLFGIGISNLILIPGNIILRTMAESDNITAYIPFGAGVILVALSVILTLLGGLIPSRKAAKSDPVTALRTD